MIFAAAFDRVLPDRAAEVSEKRKVPLYSLILMLLPAVGLSAFTPTSGTFRHLHAGRDARHRGDLPVQRRSRWSSCRGASRTCGRHRHHYRFKFMGMYRIIAAAGVVTIALLVFDLVAWFSNDLYFVNNHDSLYFMAAMYVLAILVYLVARVVRRRQGIDLSLINKEIPVE